MIGIVAVVSWWTTSTELREFNGFTACCRGSVCLYVWRENDSVLGSDCNSVNCWDDEDQDLGTSSARSLCFLLQIGCINDVCVPYCLLVDIQWAFSRENEVRCELHVKYGLYLIYGLFNYTVSSSDYTATNDSMISRWLGEKGDGNKLLWRNLRYYPGIPWYTKENHGKLALG